MAKQKRRVFTATPTTPYDVGDLWVQGGTGDIMKCKNALASGSYNAAHWEKASKYTDDTTANQAVSNTVLTPADKISLYATFLSIQNEYSRLKEQCTNLGVADTLKTSYDALYALLNSIVGTTTLQNAITTGFNKSNYDTLYKNYVTAREVLEQAQITKVYAYTNTIKEHFTTEKALAVANWFASQDKTMIDGAYIYTGTVTAKQIAANSIDTDHLAVGMNPNLVRYGLDTMEQFSTVPKYGGLGTTTSSLDDTQSFCGTKSIKLSGTTTNNYICIGDTKTKYGSVPVTPGKKYILSCYVRTTSTSLANVTLSIVGQSSISGSGLPVLTGNVGTVTNSEGWKRLVVKYTASSDYRYISIRIAVGSANIPVWFDAFQIEEVDSEDKEPGAFKQAGTTIIDGGNITTGIIKSDNYNYSSGNFAVAGTIIDLATGVIRSKGFGMDANGNSYFNGTVTATTLTANSSGEIAGWKFNGTCFWKGSSTIGQTGNSNIYLGDKGVSFSNKFIYQTATGELEINGKILASSGYIGDKVSGFTIGSKAIYNGMTNLASAATGIYLGTDGISLGGGKIKATSDGKFYATDADISGSIKLDGGLNLLTYNDVTKTNFYQKVLYTNIDKTGASPDALFCDANLYLKGGALNVGDTLTGLSYTISQIPSIYQQKLSISSNALANTVAQRTGEADINVRLIRSNYKFDTGCSGGIAFRIAAGDNTDNYIRFCNNPTSIRNFIGAAASSHIHNNIVNGIYSWNISGTGNFIPRQSGTDTSANIGANSANGCVNNVYYKNLVNKSDKRYKENINDISVEEALTIVQNLNIKSYNYKDDKAKIKNYGILGQELRDLLIESSYELFSGLAIDDRYEEGRPVDDLKADEDYVIYGVNYTQFIPLLLKVMQYVLKEIHKE